MSPVGFEPTITAGEQPQTYALDRAATGSGIHDIVLLIKKKAIDYHPSHKQGYNRLPPLLRQFFLIPNRLNNFTDLSTYFSYLKGPCIVIYSYNKTTEKH